MITPSRSGHQHYRPEAPNANQAGRPLPTSSRLNRVDIWTRVYEFVGIRQKVRPPGKCKIMTFNIDIAVISLQMIFLLATHYAVVLRRLSTCSVDDHLLYAVCACRTLETTYCLTSDKYLSRTCSTQIQHSGGGVIFRKRSFILEYKWNKILASMIFVSSYKRLLCLILNGSPE